MIDEPYRARLVTGTLAEAEGILAAVRDGVRPTTPHRAAMHAVRVLVLADLVDAPAPARAAAASALVAHLERSQGPTGLFDGDNLVSPPDTSFTINDLSLTLELLESQGDPGPADVAGRLRAVGERAVEALLVGGVHTPNHRWELSAALAGLHRLTGDERLIGRIDEWLAEGVDIDADGFYSERSPNYAAYVSNPSLLTLARLLGRPELLEPVRASLRSLVPLVDDDGEVVSIHSRRQDQRETFRVHSFAGQLRRFAVTDDDGALARLAVLACEDPRLECARELADGLVDPARLRSLPAAAAPRDGTVTLRTIGLVRRRSGAAASTVFGGSDHARTRRIASGLANSAALLQHRRGAARLHALRVAPAFFDTGAFRPDTVEVTDERVVLTGSTVSGYYQPLAADRRRADGAYLLTDEGRFFAQMDFPARERSDLRLATTVVVDLRDDGATVEVRCQGPRTRLAVELTLGQGVLVGADPHPELADALWLREGPLTLRSGSDELRVQVSGHDSGLPPRYDDGELFTYVHGEDRVPGVRVLVGGWTDQPLQVTITTGGTA
ncbi:hypothetical protein ACTHAM_001711 [Cellulomonas soli]|uniref:hypothetical protein n=1 Tax=Cellulomonas soli TaxID=931535 RepID=UPI003F84B839